MYAALGTRPDIAFAVQTLSRYSTKFGPAHWNAVKRVFSYLKGTKELWLTYGQTQAEMMGYADADGSTAEDRHAVSRYAFIINGGAVSWSAKRQSIISLSTDRLVYCPTDDMVADTLTKALPSAKVKHFAVELGLTTV
jgi:hypothetical protein